MNIKELAEIGLTPEHVLDRLVTKMLEGYSEETGDSYVTQFESEVEKKVKAHVTVLLNAAFETHIAPNVASMIENLNLQQTNEWGEKKGLPPMTFIEYLTQRADAYIREQVDYSGKAKGEEGTYNWSGRTTRIAYMINQHLHYSIETAMKNALGEVNSSVRKGLEEAVKMALANITVRMSTEVKTAP
jgi:hypothetical protein